MQECLEDKRGAGIFKTLYAHTGNKTGNYTRSNTYNTRNST